MPSSRRNRIILIVIIIVCISLVTLYVRESDTGPLHRIQNFFLDLLSPISNFFSKIFRPVKDGIVNLFHLPSLSKDKRELQKEVATLRRQASESRELEAEVEEFKRLLKWSEENAQLDTVGADIVGQSPSNWKRLMIVNKGSSSGIKKYMSVVTEEGLAGRIIAVGSRSSVVQLITDSRSGIGARDLRNRETGVIEGRNENTMRFVPMNDEAVMQVGDIMVTSGLGGTSPPGIVIGRVAQVKKRSAGLARLVEVKPFVRFSRLEKVLIIITPEPESVILKEAQ
ncbi:MAG: rod shape-determining protein MreC [Actinobacteria bacterium]|nr:rod shape-determining protein MreC [Actinomycetota bacterium]